MKYVLADFYRVLQSGLLNEISNETIAIINMLATEVGAPEYVRTPQFTQKYIVDNSVARRRKKFNDHSTDGWNNNSNSNDGWNNNNDAWNSNSNDRDTTSDFQATEFAKKVGIEAHLHTVRKYLNMLTETTFDTLKDQIFAEIITVITTKTENDLNYLCNEIYKIVSSNILYSQIYAKLYTQLVHRFPKFEELLFKYFDKIEEQFALIEYCDPETDYNGFCENNKRNQSLRATCAFYGHLMREETIQKEKIADLIGNLFKTLDTMIASATQKNEIDELSEIIYIMVVGSHKLLDAGAQKAIYDNVERITKIKSKEAPGITNKCIFKHMDMMDAL